MSAATAAHWGAALRQAAALHIGPAAFWRLSLAEWRALTAVAAPPLDRDGLQRLMRQYPDHQDDAPHADHSL